MVDNPLRSAEEAVKWAMKPYGNSPTINMYRALYIQIQGLIEAYGSIDYAVFWVKNSVLWPCLSRLLIMDDPTLVNYIKPHYIETLDSQAGTTWLCMQFKNITGKPPKMRSWRIARQEIGAHE